MFLHALRLCKSGVGCGAWLDDARRRCGDTGGSGPGAGPGVRGEGDGGVGRDLAP